MALDFRVLLRRNSLCKRREEQPRSTLFCLILLFLLVKSTGFFIAIPFMLYTFSLIAPVHAHTHSFVPKNKAIKFQRFILDSVVSVFLFVAFHIEDEEKKNTALRILFCIALAFSATKIFPMPPSFSTLKYLFFVFFYFVQRIESVLYKRKADVANLKSKVLYAFNDYPCCISYSIFPIHSFLFVGILFHWIQKHIQHLKKALTWFSRSKPIRMIYIYIYTKSKSRSISSGTQWWWQTTLALG